MPSGIYKRTKKHCKIISECHKGLVPWNKGLKLPELGKKIIGASNPYWKGDNIGIARLHRRVEILYGKPKYCEICKKIDKKAYDWANINHIYSIPIKKEEWKRLCRGCHIKIDYTIERRKKISIATSKKYKK